MRRETAPQPSRLLLFLVGTSSPRDCYIHLVRVHRNHSLSIMAKSFLPLMEIPASPTAASRVLDIGELVELVVLHLDEASIVRSRRVSKKFHETVTYSKSIRQKLFLVPESSTERIVNPLAPTWFGQQTNGYRDSTIAARINIWDMWISRTETRPLWDKMLIAQPPPTQCVIPVGHHLTIFFKRTYPEGMTFGDLESAVIAAFEIRKAKRYERRERLEELSLENSVLIYWR